MMTDKEKELYKTSQDVFKGAKCDRDLPVCDTNKVKNKNVSHYKLWDDFQVIDLMKIILTKDEYIGYLKGNLLKYKLRDKGQDEADLIKAKDYQRELNEMLKVK